MKTIKVPIEQATLDQRCQGRADVSATAVDEYRDLYAAGVEMPPPEVFEVGDALVVVDGYHRVPAAIMAGVGFLTVRVVGRGSMDDASWYAITVNQGHGVRRTNADKQRVVRMALGNPIGQEQSSATIAKRLGVSVDFVSRLRREWEDAQTAKGAPVSETTIDARGRRQPKRKPRQAPDVSSNDTSRVDADVSSDETSRPLPFEPEYDPAATAVPMPGYGPDLDDAADAVRDVRIATKRAVPDLPELAAVRQEVERVLRSAESKLRLAAPVICSRGCDGAGCTLCGSRGWVTRLMATEAR